MIPPGSNGLHDARRDLFLCMPCFIMLRLVHQMAGVADIAHAGQIVGQHEITIILLQQPVCGLDEHRLRNAGEQLESDQDRVGAKTAKQPDDLGRGFEHDDQILMT